MNYGVQTRLVDEAGNPVEADGETSGHLQVKGSWVLSRYLNHQDEDRCNYITDDGWFKTGDVAVIHTDGYLEIVDRSKDLIKSGGEWIGPAIIESCVVAHEGVKEAAVIGVPHPKWDERPLLVVVRKEKVGLRAEDLQQFLKGKIASWWIPEQVRFVDELPKTGTGKVNKVRLKEIYN